MSNPERKDGKMDQTLRHTAGRTSLFTDLQLGPILYLTGIFLINFIARVVLSPLMPTIERDLQLSHTAAGSLFLFIAIGYLAGILGSGFIAARLTHRKTIILSATSLGVTLIGIAFSQGLWPIRSGMFLLGVSAGLYLPSGIAAITALVNPRHWGKALAIHEMAPNFGFIAAPLISEMLLVSLSWREILIILGGFSMLSGAAFAFRGRGGRFAGEPPGRKSIKTLFAMPSFWIMVVLFGLGVSSTLGIYTMLPLYLIFEKGIDRNTANTFLSLSRLPGVILVFFAGWAQDRFGPRSTLALVFLIGGITTVLLGIAPPYGVVALIFFQPWVAGCFFPAGFAALSSIGPPSVRGVAVSMTLPLSMLIGGGAVPTWIGFMGDRGSFGAGISVVGGFILLGAVLSRFLKFQK